jgi:hypothetical protein
MPQDVAFPLASRNCPSTAATQNARYARSLLLLIPRLTLAWNWYPIKGVIGCHFERWEGSGVPPGAFTIRRS